MGKSMRSKAHRHKRTKRRERAQGHYDKLLEERAEVARKHLEQVRGCGASGGREPEGGARRGGGGRGEGGNLPLSRIFPSPKRARPPLAGIGTGTLTDSLTRRFASVSLRHRGTL